MHAALRTAILGGRLTAGMRLPASRTLATQLGVRRNAVVVAYEQLLSDGLAEGRPGSGTFVAIQLPRGPAAVPTATAPYPVAATGPFALGRTHADPALLKQFSQLLRRSLGAAGPEHFGYGDARGNEALRHAIAGHLAATRGVVCDPGCILVTSGTQQAIRLCAETLLRPGDAVWLEDPGYPAARRIFETLGARPVPVPVDRFGLDVAAGRQAAPRSLLAYVTPSHQFPTGVTMTMQRRLALLDWAHETQGWIMEDDYDSEFRYAGPPLTALAGIDGQARVIYLGTFSKTLFAGLRIGYAVLPPALLRSITAARTVADRFPPSLLAPAVAALITGGGFSAHVRRMRTRYKAARDLVATVLPAASAGLLEVAVPDQGLHMTALLPRQWPAGAAASIRAAAGIDSWLLSETAIGPLNREGFVLGFAGHGLPELRAAAERLGRAARAHALQLAEGRAVLS